MSKSAKQIVAALLEYGGQYPDTLSLMRAYLADPSANPEIKRWVNLMLPKE